MFSNPVLMTDATLFWSPLFAHDPLRGFMVLFVALLVAALFCAILGFGSGFLSCRFALWAGEPRINRVTGKNDNERIPRP